MTRVVQLRDIVTDADGAAVVTLGRGPGQNRYLGSKASHMCLRRPQQLVSGPDRFCDGKAVNSVLLATTDGGQTWTPLGS